MANRTMKRLRLAIEVLNSAEPYRVSSYAIFRRNLLDPALHLSVILIYVVCKLLTSNKLSFLFLFTLIFLLVNHHFESYKSFVGVRHFISGDKFLKNLERKPRKDSFAWSNRIIAFFWPYLSRLLHQELNDFLKDQIEEGLFYEIMDHLIIEKCQLGAQSPQIKNLSASPGQDKTLVYNLNLVYNGDMNISMIYRYLGCCSSRVGLKDVFLHFNIRLTLGPILERGFVLRKGYIPSVEAIRLTLLELPDFGYKGIALAELAELKIVRKLINRLIRKYLLHPRQVTVELRKLIEARLTHADKKTDKLTSLSSKKSAAAAAEASSSRIETHPGKIEHSGERPPLSASAGAWTKLRANALICGCLGANFLLRCCQWCGHEQRNVSPSSARQPAKEAAASIKFSRQYSSQQTKSVRFSRQEVAT